MQNAPQDHTPAQTNDRDNTYQLIVSDLSALIDRVHASMDLIESAISREKPFGNQEAAGNVIVLDDITPSYMRANAALNACSVDLSVALHFLMDIKACDRNASDFVVELPRSPSPVRA